MTPCTHSNRIICEHCAEREIRNGSLKPMKGTLAGESAELNEALRELSRAIEAACKEVARDIRKMFGLSARELK